MVVAVRNYTVVTTSPHSLEIRFNVLWILALQGEEHEADRFAAELSRIVEAGR